METDTINLRGDWFLRVGNYTDGFTIVACRVWRPNSQWDLTYVLDELENDIAYPNKFSYEVHKRVNRFLGVASSVLSSFVGKDSHTKAVTQAVLQAEFDYSVALVNAQDARLDALEQEAKLECLDSIITGEIDMGTQ